GMRHSLDHINKVLSPGIRTFDELLRDMGWASDEARRALSSTPEPSTIPCCKCGGVVVEFSVPNDVWNKVVRRDGPETDQEYLCEGCYRDAVSEYVRATPEPPRIGQLVQNVPKSE